MEYITVKEAALKWDVSTRLVQILAASGKLHGKGKMRALRERIRRAFSSQ